MDSLENILLAIFIITAVLIAGLLLTVMVRLAWAFYAERMRLSFNRRWQPLLSAWMEGNRLTLPALPGRRSTFHFMNLWTRTCHYVEGEAADLLHELASAMKLDEHAAAMLTSRAASKRVLALVTLGEMQSHAYWREIHAQITDAQPVVALAAIEALAQVDARRAAPLVVPALLARPHWDPVRVSRLLQRLGGEALEPLLVALRKAEPGQGARVIRWLGATGQIAMLEPMRERLQSVQDIEELVALLEVMGQFGGAEDRGAALRYLDHADWRVRMQAVKALGQVGLAEDRPAMAALLTDLVWWVRYRAAGALYQLRGETVERFKKLATMHPDRFARDSLRRVLAEKTQA